MCDFFDPIYQTEGPRSDARFGIGDDGVLAFTTFEDADTVTVVNNPAGVTVQFVPVDHNIPIRNENGTDASLCDAMIHAPIRNDIYFIEMKNRNKKWISEATDQLKSTIRHFSQHHPIDMFRFKVATASNRQKPFFDYSHKDECAQFRRDTKFRLNINTIVDIRR